MNGSQDNPPDLYNNEHNKNNYKLLIDGFDRNVFVAFIGAGPSTALKGMPNWEELYESLRKQYGKGLTKKFEGPISMSKLYKKCSQKEGFFRSVFDLVKLKGASGNTTHNMMIKAFDCYVTTNFYDPIEAVFPLERNNAKVKKYYFVFPGSDKELQYEKPERLNHDDNQKNSITFLHGHSDVGFGILRKEDYDLFYPSTGKGAGIHALENSLKYLFTKKIIVFIGSQFEENIRKFLEYLNNSATKDVLHEQFWLIRDSTLKVELNVEDLATTKEGVINDFFESYLKKYKIRPIVYLDHTFIDKLCNTLTNARPPIGLEQPDTSKAP